MVSIAQKNAFDETQLSYIGKSILLVDDDETFRHRLARAFSSRGLAPIEAGSVAEALTTLKTKAVEWILVDLKMPGASGLELVSKIKELATKDEIRIVVLTGFGTIATAMHAIKLGAFNYISKPIDADRILKAFVEPPEHSSPNAAITPVPTLDSVEWEHINRVLSECEGNITKAAKLLKIERRSLQRKLAKFSPRF